MKQTSKSSTSGSKHSISGSKPSTLGFKPSTSGFKHSISGSKPFSSGFKPSASGSKSSKPKLKHPSSTDPSIIMKQTPEPSAVGSHPSSIPPKFCLKLSTCTQGLGMPPSNPATMNTMDQTLKPPSSPSRVASPAPPSSVDGQDHESDSGITGRLEGSSTLKKRTREDELHNEGTSPPSKKVSRPLMDRTNPPSNTAKNAELINSNFNEGYIIGDVGTRSMRKKKNATGQSNPDPKDSELISGSSRKKLDQMGAPPLDKTLKPNNPKSTVSKKRKRQETDEADVDIVNNQTQLDSSKEVLPSAINSRSILDSQDNMTSSSTSGTGTQQPSGVNPGRRIIKLNLSPAQLAQVSAGKEAGTEHSAAATRTSPSFSHNRTDTQPFSGVDPGRTRIKFRGYEAVQEAAQRAAQRAAQEAATGNTKSSLRTPPSSSGTAFKETKTNPTKKNRAKKKTEKKKRVPCAFAQIQWLGMQSPDVQKKLSRKADEAEAFFPNDNVITTKDRNGKLVTNCHGDYYVPQNSSSSLLRAEKAKSADSFTYKVYLPSSFTEILVHTPCMPKYFKYMTETVSDAGLQKKAKIQRMIREAEGEKLMFEFDPSMGEHEEIERQFANEFKFGASAERDPAMEKDLRRRMKVAMTELKSIRENGLAFKEMRSHSLNFPEPTKKERIVELKQTILHQIEKERNSATYEGGNEGTRTAEEWAAFQSDAQLLLDFSRANIL